MNSYEQPKQPAPKQAIHRSATVTLFVKQNIHQWLSLDRIPFYILWLCHNIVCSRFWFWIYFI